VVAQQGCLGSSKAAEAVGQADAGELAAGGAQCSAENLRSVLISDLQIAFRSERGFMVEMQISRLMPELLNRQIERLEVAIDLSTDWLEIQYLISELDQLKALYDEADIDAA